MCDGCGRWVTHLALLRVDAEAVAAVEVVCDLRPAVRVLRRGGAREIGRAAGGHVVQIEENGRQPEGGRSGERGD